jgi:hypothetical protein
MRTLLFALVLASAATAQVRVTVTVQEPPRVRAAPPPARAVPVRAAPVYILEPVLVAPVPMYALEPAPVFVPAAPVLLVPARTPWYPTKWLSGRRGQ